MRVCAGHASDGDDDEEEEEEEEEEGRGADGRSVASGATGQVRLWPAWMWPLPRTSRPPSPAHNGARMTHNGARHTFVQEMGGYLGRVAEGWDPEQGAFVSMGKGQ